MTISSVGDLSPDIWYDISDISTLFKDDAGTDPVTTDGDRVALVLDKSGNDVHLRQTTVSDRPVFRDDGTYRWLAFDGVDHMMKSDSVAFTQPNTRGFVFGTPGVVSSVRPVADGAGSSDRNYMGLQTDGHITFWADDFIQGHKYNLNNEKDYMIAVFNGASSTIEHDKGGGRGTVGTNASDGVTLGARYNGSPRTECDVYEYAEFNRALSDTEQKDLKEYYEVTYGIDDTPKDFVVEKLSTKPSGAVLYGVVADNDKVYAPSFEDANSDALVVDTSDDSQATIALGPGFSGAAFGNGKVYAAPFKNEANQEVGIIDTSDDSTSSVAIPNATTSNRYYGQTEPIGDFIYFSPYEGGEVLRVNTTNDTVEFFGDTLDDSSGNAYGSNVVAGDFLYIINRSASSVQVFNTTDGTHIALDTSGHDTISAGGDVKWVGGILAPNGKIYCTPRSADNVLIIDTADDSLSSVSSLVTDVNNKWNGQALLPNGLVCFFTRSVGENLLVDPSNDTVRFAKIIYEFNGAVDSINIDASDAWVGAVQFKSDDTKFYSIPFFASYGLKWTSLNNVSGVSGSGDLVAQPATLAGAAERTITGSGTPQAQQAALDGSGGDPGSPVFSYFTAFVSGGVSTPGNALGAPDGVFTTDGNTQASWVARWQFENTGDVVDPAKTQEVTLRVRKGTNASDPTVDLVTLYQNGTSVATLLNSATAVTSTSGEDIILSFSGSVLDGTTAGVDLEISVTGPGGPPNDRNSVELDATTWQIGTGVATHTASGSLQAAQATAAGSGAIDKKASGSLLAPVAMFSGTGAVGRVASGGLQAGQATLSGTASPVITGSGTPQAQPATLAGVAERTITGSSALAAGGAAVAGVITRSITGNGSLSAQQAALDGSGDVSGAITGSGAFIAQTATLVALGAISREASGALQAGQAEVSGTAERVVTGGGVLTAQQAAIDGQAARVATADGALGADAASVTASATLTRTGSSALQATDAVLSGEGDVDSVVTSGEGVLTAQQATVAGAGTRTVTGTGTTQAQTVQITGESVREITGSGALQADQAISQGDGGPLVAGAGDFQAQVAQASGEGQVTAAPRTGEGQLVALTANLDAGILRTVKASGAVSADPAETVVHPWIELHTQDSQWTVQKADWGKDL